MIVFNEKMMKHILSNVLGIQIEINCERMLNQEVKLFFRQNISITSVHITTIFDDNGSDYSPKTSRLQANQQQKQ